MLTVCRAARICPLSYSFIIMTAKHAKGLIYAKHSSKLISSRVQVQAQRVCHLSLYAEPRMGLYGCSGCALHMGALSEGASFVL